MQNKKYIFSKEKRVKNLNKFNSFSKHFPLPCAFPIPPVEPGPAGVTGPTGVTGYTGVTGP
ncbi:hypothetical protein CN476_22295, partial [Bacillus cereus]